ncbi:MULTISPECIES: hypothetical protein [Acinetobacter]|uniref:hypothetical protein n=1 Tax=Acinetobacter TaxID=469 RepID=UPI000D002398|nr:hypothetical protein [Acinetobacter sp. MYb10]QLD60006.1 hypothetical protein CQZ96_001520 [Acinetobacter sp. MYb10]
MKKKIISIVFCFLSMSVFAEVDLDRTLFEAGVVDHNYRIIDTDAFDEIMRGVTNNINAYAPIKIDTYTTFDTAIFTRFGIYINITIKELSKGDLSSELKDKLLNNLCKEDLFRSETVKMENIPFNINIYGENGEKIFNEKFKSSDCYDED